MFGVPLQPNVPSLVMTFHVVIEQVAIRENFPTMYTSEDLFTQVLVHVDFILLICVKHDIAFITYRLGMYSRNMPLHGIFMLKLCSAIRVFTGYRFMIFMNIFHMIVQGPFMSEPNATLGTKKGAFSGMFHSFVHIELPLALILSTTLVTLRRIVI